MAPAVLHGFINGGLHRFQLSFARGRHVTLKSHDTLSLFGRGNRFLGLFNGLLAALAPGDGSNDGDADNNEEI